jgi:hypothetical protein
MARTDQEVVTVLIEEHPAASVVRVLSVAVREGSTGGA